MEKRIFTYPQAIALLEEVRAITRFHSDRMESVRSQSPARPGTRRHHKVNEWCNRIIEEWAAKVSALGALPKGLWTVDFDSGEGFYYCWVLDEPMLGFVHDYAEGFSGRRPLRKEGEHAPEDDRDLPPGDGPAT